MENTFHVKFFDARKELFKETIKVLQKGDHIFLSGDKAKKAPLWHTHIHGTILDLDINKQTLFLDIINEEKFEDKEKRTKFTKVSFSKKKVKFDYFHGFRIDQERIYSVDPNFIKKYDISVHPMSYAKPFQVQCETPYKTFLEDTQPGDYVTIWSGPDAIKTKFVHYPVQGWLNNKNLETTEIDYIHPPNMNIKKFPCNHPNNMIGYGFYRKLVYQLSNLNVKD